MICKVMSVPRMLTCGSMGFHHEDELYTFGDARVTDERRESEKKAKRVKKDWSDWESNPGPIKSELIAANDGSLPLDDHPCHDM